MTILVDLDHVLVNTGDAWVEVLNERHGTTVKYDDITEWDVSKFFPTLSHDEVYEPLVSGEVWSRVSPVRGARETLEKIIADGHEVYIATASSLETIGKKWNEVIQKYYPMIPYDHVIVAHRKQMIVADVLIDDAPFNLNGGKYFSILFDAPHNRDDREHTRAHDWDEVYRVINTIDSLMKRFNNRMEEDF